MHYYIVCNACTVAYLPEELPRELPRNAQSERTQRTGVDRWVASDTYYCACLYAVALLRASY